MSAKDKRKVFKEAGKGEPMAETHLEFVSGGGKIKDVLLGILGPTMKHVNSFEYKNLTNEQRRYALSACLVEMFNVAGLDIARRIIPELDGYCEKLGDFLGDKMTDSRREYLEANIKIVNQKVEACKLI